MIDQLEKWIWLDGAVYPEYQLADYSGHFEVRTHRYAVAEFSRRYAFEKKIVSAALRFSGDTEFQLFLNGECIAAGPVSVGGDFLFNDFPRPTHYASRLTLVPDCSALDFFARVKLGPVGINEYSQGHGGFMLTCELTFEDGTRDVLCTDETWLARRSGAFCEPWRYDGTIAPEAWLPAVVTPNRWHSITAPIPLRTEALLSPEGSGVLTVPAGETAEAVFLFDKIHAGFLSVAAEADGPVECTVHCFETDEDGSCECLSFAASDDYRGLQLHSAGGLRVRAHNGANAPAVLRFALIATHYPAPGCARTVTSDAGLNRILDVCAHTLKYCRQMIHLDSPRHSEPLACTGDYYIEMLMTAFSYGDQRLSLFDVRRTAELLRFHDGRMFHTSYSLIWVLMLEDAYMLTGDASLLSECEDALLLLLRRFHSYLGKNGLLETPPDYMFVDWIYIDGISLHHPPKALGQSCLNMFYYGALCAAARIFSALNEPALREECLRRAAALKTAVNALLYDPGKALYFEGLNTPTPDALLGQWMPQNVSKRYYRCHANILAACFGVCDVQRGRTLLRRVLSDASLGDCQPYFKHFLLEAIYRCGLREECTLSVLDAWRKPVDDCPRGLAEGFIKPEPTYSFDHSHAWGGTPLYALPKALTGLEILEPGFARVRLCPRLLGLERARVEIPTPHGQIVCEMEQGAPARVTAPEGVALEII